MNLINDDVGNIDANGSDIIKSEEEFSRKMAEEVYDESGANGDEDLDLYQIIADELQEEGVVDFEREMKNLFKMFFVREGQTEGDEDPEE